MGRPRRTCWNPPSGCLHGSFSRGSCTWTTGVARQTSPSALASQAHALEAVGVGSQLVVGVDRFPVGVLDRKLTGHGRDRPREGVRRLGALASGEKRSRRALPAPFHGGGLKGRGLYVAHLQLDRAGKWLAEIGVSLADGTPRSVAVPFQVLGSSSAPSVGQPAPPSHNLTAADVGDVFYIDSGAPPDDMHSISIADAIAEHRPAPVVFATPAFCSSARDTTGWAVLIPVRIVRKRAHE